MPSLHARPEGRAYDGGQCNGDARLHARPEGRAYDRG
jgi:hypothetical protein